MSLLSRLFRRNAAPELLIDAVWFDSDGVTRREPNGRMTTLEWRELREVALMNRLAADGLPSPRLILTGQSGGILADLHVDGADRLVKRIASMRGYDHAAFMEAISRNDPLRIVFWRPPGMPAPASTTSPGVSNGANAFAPAPPRAPEPPQARLREAAATPGGGAIRMDIAPTRATAAAYAADTVRLMHEIHHVDMDWSVASLNHIDGVLQGWRKHGLAVDRMSKSIYALACYAGEVVLREAKGQWGEPLNDDPEDFEDLFLSVHLDDGREWNPIALCIDLLAGGTGPGVLRSAATLLGYTVVSQGSV
jgi:hypothetical protein